MSKAFLKMERNMKKLLTGIIALIMASAVNAADEVKLQLQWVTQAQFAGYYVALDKGFYKDEGLDVTILPGGPDVAPPQVLAGGGADVMLNWMPSALAAREKGLPVVNIAQPFKSSGLMLTCWKDTGIKSPADFKGRTIGVWFFGNEYPFLSWMSQEGISTDDISAFINKMKLTNTRMGFNTDIYQLIEGDVEKTIPVYLEKNPGFRISYLYLDLDIDKPTYASLNMLYDRIVRGGIIVFDEYACEKWTESNAVDRFLNEHPNLNITF